jgi:hypothetical protein
VVVSSENVTTCACTHLTQFNIASEIGVAPNTITEAGIQTAFSLNSISKHPTPLIVVSVLMFLWLVVSLLFCRRELRDKGSLSGYCCSTDAALRVIDDDNLDLKEISQFDCCDRNSFDYRLSTQNSAVFYMEAMNALPSPLSPEEEASCCNWLLDSRWVTVVRKNAWMNFCVSHPFLSVQFHHPRDPYNTLQRISVACAIFFCYAATNAMFFGRATSAISSIATGMYASLVVIPVAVIFPVAFQTAAYLLECEAGEAAFLESFKIELKLFPRSKYSIVSSSSGWQLLISTWVSLFLLCFGTLFVIFVYASQFDNNMIPGQTATSTQWLVACLASFAQGMFFNCAFSL